MLGTRTPSVSTGSQKWASPVTRSSNGCWTWFGGVGSDTSTSLHGVSCNQYGKRGLETKAFPRALFGINNRALGLLGCFKSVRETSPTQVLPSLLPRCRQ